MSQLPFSIVIPVYNRSALLRRAINSVINQTYQNFELIIADDASEEDIKEVVSSFNDQRIKYVRSPENKGNAAARNAGVRASSNELIAFLDSDDSYENDYLEKISAVCTMASNKTGFWWCGIKVVDKNDFVKKEGCWKPNVPINSKYSLFYGLHIGTNNGLVVRRSVYDAVNGFDENLRAAVDTDFILRISKITEYSIVEKNMVRYQYDLTSDSVRKSKLNQSLAYNHIVKKHRDVWNFSKTLKFKWFYKALWLSYYSNNKREARKYFIQIPFHLKTIIIFLLFECFPINIAKSIHIQFASKGFQ
jgi:glycosyltransferase involved in cell wall biosynthesis